MKRRTLTRLGAGLAGLLTVTGLATTAAPQVQAATPTINLSGYDAARTDGDWGLTEPYLATMRGYVTDSASFGPSGTVDATYTVSPTGVNTATAATLAGVDVFFTGWVLTSSYTPAEKTALRDYVLGGGALIATTDDTSHTMVDVFGLTQGTGGGAAGAITDTVHPIAAGPFGPVTSYGHYGTIGHYSALGADAVELGENSGGTSIAVIEPGELGAGSGPVVFVSDVDVFSNAYAGATANKTLIQNVFAYLAGPTDSSPPVITPNVVGTLGNNGWYTGDVSVSWTVTDPESAFTTVGCGTTSITSDTAGTSASCEATSAGGTASDSVQIKRDATKPVVSLVGGPVDGGSYVWGSVPPAPTCSASDATSGLAAGPPCSVSGYGTALGPHTVVASATDNAGNTETDSHAYTVTAYTLSGFYHPVDMGGVLNMVKAGRTVPLKFEVFAGATELTDPAGIVMSATGITCPSSPEADDVELTSTGSTSLRYDTVAGQFIYNWKTPSTPGACVRVTATSADGSSVSADFQLR